MSFKILLPVETAARELVYKSVLAHRFADLGYECFLGSKREINELFSRVKPFVYFDKGYHPSVSEQIYDQIKKHDGVIVNLDEEGGVDFKHSKTILARYPDVLFDVADLVFIWGQQQHALIHQHRRHVKPGKLVVSGHPRFDLLKPQYRTLYQEAAQSLVRRYGKFILINTNMGFGNNIKGLNFVRQNYGCRIANIDEIVAFDQRKAEQIVHLVRSAAEVLPFNIVIRPHPEESHRFYSDQLHAFKNVFVVYEDSVVPWIMGAEIVIHPDCTTAIEAVLLGKRPLSFLPEEFEPWTTTLPIKVSRVFHAADELIRHIQRQEHLQSPDPPSAELLEPTFSLSESSTDVVVREVHRHISRLQPPESYSIGLAAGFIQKLGRRGVQALGRRLKPEKYRFEDSKLAGLSGRELACLNDKIATLTGGVSVKITSLSGRLFKFDKFSGA